VPEHTALEAARTSVRGERAELRVEDGVVSIEKHPPRGTPSTVTFPVSRIRAAQLRAPARGSRGWLHVSVVGGSPAPPGELAASSDPYSLPLGVRNAPAARRFVRLVDRHVQERGMPRDDDRAEGRSSTGVSLRAGAPAPVAPSAPVARSAPTAAMPPPPPPPPPPPADAPELTVGEDHGPLEIARELESLAHLHARGVLTDEEFERAKARVLR
jgi:hypothetical protein